jgi:hypothetical protein
LVSQEGIVMKKLSGILFGLLFLSAPSRVFAELNQPEVQAVPEAVDSLVISENVENTSDEVEKWLFLEKYFASNIDSSKFHQKIGRFLNERSSTLSALTAPVIGAVAAFCFFNDIIDSSSAPESYRWCRSYKDKFRFWAHKASIPSIVVVSPFITFLVINKILQSVGKRIENKKGRCSQILTDFVKNWDICKAQTPTSMHPLFQKLSEKLSQNGTLTQIDNNLAQRIVESIIATALMVSSVK